MPGLLRLVRRRRPREVELEVRAPSLGADLDLRVAVSPAIAAEAGYEPGDGPAPGLLSGDGPLVLPETVDERTARRVLDAIAPAAPRHYASPEALVDTARVAFAKYVADRAAHETWAGVSSAAVAHACGVSVSGGDAAGRSDLERFSAAGMEFADWQALMDAPLVQALAWLGHRAAQGAIENEG